MLSKTPPPTSEANEKSVSKRGRGRPKGSKNKDYDVVLSVPAACKCGSNRIKKLPRGKFARPDQVQRIQYLGKHYQRVRWSKAYCLDCGQRIDLREFMEPEAEANNSSSDF